MKDSMIVSALLCSLALGCSSNPHPATQEQPEPGRAVMDERFANGLGAWKITNHQKMLTYGTTNEAGVTKFFIWNASTDFKRKRFDTLFLVKSDFVPVTGGSEYAIVVEARGSIDMTSSVCQHRENGQHVNTPATALIWYGADKKPILIQDPLGRMIPSYTSFGFRSMSENGMWLKSVTKGVAPAGAAYAVVQFGGDSPDVYAQKRLEVRRICLKLREGKNGDWYFGDLVSPKYARTSVSPDPNPNAPIVFKVLDDSALDMTKFRCTLDGVDVTGKVKREKESFVYKPETPWAKDSLHILKVEATDVWGNASEESLAHYCGEPMKGDTYRVRDDGMILKNGKPIFLIGSSAVRLGPPNDYNAEKLITEVMSNGFNCGGCVYVYKKDMKPHQLKEMNNYLDVCDKHGFMIWTELACREYGTKKRFNEMLDSLAYVRKHPSIFMWDLADDTASHTTPLVVRNDNNICHAIDNLRLTMQPDIASYSGRYEPFADCTDCLRLELYPFRTAIPEPAGLAQLKRDCRFAFGDLKRSGAKNRSIISIPQAFSGWGLWKRFPTRSEIRAQSYLSIIEGCRGVTYYSYYSFTKNSNPFAKTPEQKEIVYSVTREMASIGDDLASRDAKVQPTVTVLDGPAKDLHDNPSVTCLLKEGADGKGKMLIAANARNDKAVKVKIDVKGKLEAMFEDGRVIDASNGLVETFAPEAVHIYRVE